MEPLPSLEELEGYYQKEYYSTSKGANLCNYEIKTELEREYYNLIFEDQKDLLNIYSPSNSILDVGCGSGTFLEFMKKNGSKTAGLEISENEVKIAKLKNLDVIEGTFFNLEQFFKHESFGAINLTNILEHTPNPKEILRKCHNLLEKNGIIYVQVPNDFSPFQLSSKEVKIPQYWITPPEHLIYFTKTSLKNLVESEHFEIKYTTATFPIDMFLLMGDDYTDNPILGKELFLKIARFELNLEKHRFGKLRKKIKKSLSDIGLGRNLILIAKKN